MTQSSDEKAAEEFCSNLPVHFCETVGEEHRRIFIAGIEHGKEKGAREMAERIKEDWDFFFQQSIALPALMCVDGFMQLWRKSREEKK